MTATKEQYDKAIDTFVAGMQELGEDLKGILLYGSVVGDRLVPGRSDLLDAYVFFSQRTLESPTGYRRVVKKLVEQCATMSQAGLPYKHPPHYHGDEETMYLPREFLPEMLSDDWSRVLCGENLRSTFPEESEGMLTAVIEEVRQYGYLHLTNYLAKDDLDLEDRVKAVRSLDVWVRKFVLIWAAASVGTPTPAPMALEKLRRLFPDIDFTVADAIAELKKRKNDPPESDELKTLLLKSMTMCEKLYEHIVEK
jgi:hypothetical protein